MTEVSDSDEAANSSIKALDIILVSSVTSMAASSTYQKEEKESLVYGVKIMTANASVTLTKPT